MKSKPLTLLILGLLLLAIIVWVYQVAHILPINRIKYKSIVYGGKKWSTYIILGNATLPDEVQFTKEVYGKDSIVADLINYNYVQDFVFKTKDTITIIVEDTSGIGNNKVFDFKVNY